MSQVFHDVRIPITIDYDSRVVQATMNDVVETLGGKRKVNRLWANRRWTYDLSYTIQSQAQYDELRTFFLLRNGSEFSFRAKDWSDYSLISDDQGHAQDVVNASHQMQIYKHYSDSVTSYARKITKPITGTLSIVVGASPHTDWTCNYSTGMVTFTANYPTGINHIYVTCEFDVHVTFGRDSLPASFSMFQHYDFDGIPLVEVKE